MQDPVIAADGYSYERGAIAQWLESGKVASPMTNEPLEHSMLIPNKTLDLLLRKLTN
ncbi:WD repeat [Tropilaelaps mercedesae]|uniref:WD repeat n=1 Tax=Tropilaelaps mercedesae TaxID=418985 RepID=A0A1V9XFM6_9ACAR|nr:WD repeat [Tropilaelaps mercedesae]